jgi:hypothetical protein
LSSELLRKLADLDSRAAEVVAEGAAEAEKLAASLGGQVEELEKAAEEALERALRERAEELAAGREKELAAVDADRHRQLESIASVPDGRVAGAAEEVARRLVED